MLTCNWDTASTVLITALCDRGVKGTDLSGTWTFQATNIVYFNTTFSGAFVKLGNATISFVMCVCPSVCMEQLVSHWTDFHEIWYLSIFRKSVEKIQVSLKSNKNNSGTLLEDHYTFFIVSRSVLLRMKNVSDKRCRETRKTHFMFNNSFQKITPFIR